jgi:curli biogenesis system outer membrane secretion channel CsgG
MRSWRGVTVCEAPRYFFKNRLKGAKAISSFFMKFFYLIPVLLTCAISNQSLSQARTKKAQAPQKTAAENQAVQAVPPQQPPLKEEIKPVAGDPTKDNVAIYPFTSAAGYDYTYAESMGNAVESGFVRSARFNVVERNRFGSISSEERFKEVNTDNVVKIAAKMGAKYIVTGYVTGANTSALYSTYDHSLTGYQTTISLAFKIIEVETGLIKISEPFNIIGQGASTALAKGNAYASVDIYTRRIIAATFPQRFKFMAVGATEVKKKQPVLTTFKVWAGSDNGLKIGDWVEVYTINYIVNPNTQKRVEEKNNIGFATITAINSGSTSTYEVYKPQKYGAQMLDAVTKTPDLVVIEYTGGVKPKGFFDF